MNFKNLLIYLLSIVFVFSSVAEEKVLKDKNNESTNQNK